MRREKIAFIGIVSELVVRQREKNCVASKATENSYYSITSYDESDIK